MLVSLEAFNVSVRMICGESGSAVTGGCLSDGGSVG